MGLIPRIACPVCGMRFHISWLERIPTYEPDPLILMKPKGKKHGFMVVHRVHDYMALSDFLGADSRYYFELFAIKMLNVLKKWVYSGLVSKSLILDELRFLFPFKGSSFFTFGSSSLLELDGHTSFWRGGPSGGRVRGWENE